MENIDNTQKQAQLKELVSNFANNIERYKSTDYDEANVRVDYIDKLFELIGWDVRNIEGLAEQYRDVVREDKIHIQGKPKAPDYSFRIGGYRKFFVEAKKPSVNIKEKIEPAYQLRRYGYTAKMSLSILTDFEEFAIYDTKVKPNQNDKPSVARIFYCKYDEYEKLFDFLQNTFSKNAIQKGSFDKYVDDKGVKKGTSEVDKEFLKLIEGWRNELAKNIAIRNKDIDIYALNNAVQKIIDRIIFLRIAEDRNMEKYGTLQNITTKDNIYPLLTKIFGDADGKYNSGLFKIEAWINNLSIDDSIIKTIIKTLYYPECPYELSIMPIELLGQVYEQFLGKTVRLTDSHQAKVEEKPEVRKAGGVYYTPEYIVYYIVDKVVGEKLKSKSTEEAKTITILDTACGSGSFLVGAYSYLLKWHLIQHTKDDASIKKAMKKGILYQVKENDYRLSTDEKQSILLSSIYGVDIDTQAVEISKLSLLLKLLEDEYVESADSFISHTDAKLLPNLENNIKDGNSLVSDRYYSDKALNLFDEHSMRKLNTFNWNDEFADIIQNGGFDCVIGNPPYINIASLDNKKEKAPLQEMNYKTFTSSSDIYCLFYEKGISLLKKNGLLGFITSNKWMRAGYGGLIRKFFLENSNPKVIIDFGGFKIFKDATVDTNILILEKAKNKNKALGCIIKDDFVLSDNKLDNTEVVEYFKKNKIKCAALSEKNWLIISEKEYAVKKKIEEKGTPLKDWDININYGIKTAYNEAFIIDGAKKDELIKADPKSAEIIKPILRGRDIKRYSTNFQDLWLIDTHNGYKTETEEQVPRIDIKDYPAIKEHIKKYWKKVKIRLDQGDTPYNLRSCTYHQEFEKDKIVWAETSDKIKMSPVKAGVYLQKTCFIITGKNLKYIMTLYNSKLIDFYARNTLSTLGKKGMTLTKDLMQTFSIPKISEEEQEPFIKLADQMIEANIQLKKAISASDIKLCQKRIDIIDNQIDTAVYDLYDLTPAERKIIENS